QNAQKALENSTDTRERREAQFILSNIDGAEGRIKEQKERLNALVKANPRFIPAINAMGQIMLREKQFKAAGSYFDTALKISAQDLDALVGRAAVYRLERKPTEAVKRLSEAIAAHPGEVEPLAQRGRIFREMGKLKEALADLDQAKKLAGNDYWIAYDRGRTLLALDKKRDALAEFKRAEKINPSIFASYVYSAGINDELNDYNAAMHDYEALARIKPDYYFGLEMLGIHYMREKRYAAARDVFRQAHSVAPTAYNYALLSVINGLYAGDRPQQFKPYIEEIMRKIDRSKSEYSMMRLFYEFAGDSDVIRRIGAEKDLPTKAKNLFYLANYYEARGNNALAQKMFEEFRLLQRRETMEWRIYELVVESGSLKTVTVSTNDGGQS
ncbi:MAG: tetratricopeptide repeat protein, partial [Spirochaetaceae bacterium]|nr:tetratricopeptide repeat protein [Spirochaetaceae bacterium]